LCETTSIEKGTHQTDGKNYLKFSCADGFLIIKDLQLEGKKRMPISDFLRGYRFN
jgi:methionyl-tRNA formyltransferase